MSDLVVAKRSGFQECPSPSSHFTHVVKTGRLVFVSGCVATDAEGRTVGATTPSRRPARCTRISEVLAAAGATFADVCKVTVFLKERRGSREKVTSRAASTSARTGRPRRWSRSRASWRDDLVVEIEAIAVLPE